MLYEAVLAGWALTVALATAVGARLVTMLRSESGRARSPRGSPSRRHDGNADALALEQLLDEVGGVVDLIEAEASRLEAAEDGRTLNLARSLLASSVSRYRERVPPEV